MAIYHCSIKVFSRGKGASAVMKAAYRAAEIITSEYDGQIHDYTRKRGMIHKEILLPEYAPKEYANRAVLWNAVEKSEKMKHAQLAREIEVSLPVELTHEQNISLVREYVNRQFVEKGMCADVCVHDMGKGNPHVHIMLTMRPINKDGTWGAKSKKEYIFDGNGERVKLKNGEFKTRKICTVDWNEQSKAEEWRSAWADAVNTALVNENAAARIDHRSFVRQGLEQVPTVHLGPAASQMEQKGIRTELGDKNRAIEVTNRQLRQLRARLNKLQNWLEESTDAAEPNLQDVISEIISGGREYTTNWQKSADLNTASKVLVFLQNNHITDMAELQEKIAFMRGQFNILREKLKKTDRRLTVLDEHIKQAEYYQEFKTIYKQYQEQKPKHKDVFYQQFAREIILYESAKRYLDAHLNGHGLPLKAWKSERANLTTERAVLYREYTLLKDETQKIEQIKRTVESLVSADAAARDVFFENGKRNSYTR